MERQKKISKLEKKEERMKKSELSLRNFCNTSGIIIHKHYKSPGRRRELSKDKDKGGILKVAREKSSVIYRKSSIRFLNKNIVSQRQWNNIQGVHKICIHTLNDYEVNVY